MTREEFSKMLVDAREVRGVSRYVINKAMQRFDNQVMHIEKASHNYAIKYVFQYVQIIRHQLMLIKNGKELLFDNETDLLNYIKQTRLKLCSQVEFSKRTNHSVGTIKSIESGRVALTVDAFLFYADALGFEIKLKSND